MTNRNPDISILLPDDATVAARGEALISELRSERSSRPPGHKPRQLAVVLAAIFALGGSVAWAAGVFSADQIDVEAGVACADEPSPSSDLAIFISAADPVAKCAKTWREGAVRTGDTTPPELTACTEENGGVIVYPGGPGVCTRLGMVPLPADYASVGVGRARAYAAFRSLTVPTATSDCPSSTRQAELARDHLARDPKLATVEVVIEGDEPCGGGYNLVEDHIAVVTVSARQAEWNRFARARRIARSVAEARCLTPTPFVQAAKRALAAANLGDIGVRVDGDGECVGPGENDNTQRTVASFPALSRDEWDWLSR